MNSLLALRERTFQTDEMNKQTNAISLNSGSATREVKAGLKSRVRGREWDQARVGDETWGLQQLKGAGGAGDAEPQLGEGSSDSRATGGVHSARRKADGWLVMGLVQGVWQRGEVSATLKGWLRPL